GRDRHQPANAVSADPTHRAEQLAEPVTRHAALLALTRDVHLHERLDGAPAAARALVELAGEVEAVERVDHVEEVDGLLGLVRLELADEVPRHRPPELRDLGARLLHAVLAERPHPPRDRLGDPPRLDRLRDGNQPHVVRTPARALRRARAALEDTPE